MNAHDEIIAVMSKMESYGKTPDSIIVSIPFYNKFMAPIRKNCAGNSKDRRIRNRLAARREAFRRSAFIDFSRPLE